MRDIHSAISYNRILEEVKQIDIEYVKLLKNDLEKIILEEEELEYIRENYEKMMDFYNEEKLNNLEIE